jgi:hypothetical protein
MSFCICLLRQMYDREWAKEPQRVMRGHQLSVTCVALSDDDRTAFTGSKDCTIVRRALGFFCAGAGIATYCFC